MEDSTNGQILIAIPSRSRAEGLKKDTHSFIKHSKFPYKIFVEPQQYESYSKSFTDDELVIIDANDEGLCYAKLCIQEYARENNYKYVFKMDDDINNIRVRNITELKEIHKVDRKFRTQTFLDKAIDDSLIILEELGSQIKGVSFCYGQELRQEDLSIIWDRLNKRFQSSYIVETEHLFPYPEHLDNSGFEDFDTFFHLVHSGFNTVRHEQLGLDYRPVGKNAGGVQDFDRGAAVLKTKEIMSEKYPYLKWKPVKKTWTFEPDIARTKEFQSIKL